MAFEYLDLIRRADFPYEIAHSYGTATHENRLAVFRRPNEVILEVKERMRCFAVELHLYEYILSSRKLLLFLKGSPEGEGFPPKGGH